MSKRGRKCRRWHYERIQREFDRKPEELIREMFEDGEPLTVMAAVLGISYGEMHEWAKELGLTGRRHQLRNRFIHAPVKERIKKEYGIDAVQLICSERANGMTYQEIQEKYGVSGGFVAHCLHRGAPWLIGDHLSPVRVKPPTLSDEERRRRSECCKAHNARMKKEKRGWFADMKLHFDPKKWRE